MKWSDESTNISSLNEYTIGLLWFVKVDQPIIILRYHFFDSNDSEEQKLKHHQR